MKGGRFEGGLLALVVIIAVIAYAIMYIAIAAGVVFHRVCPEPVPRTL